MTHRGRLAGAARPLRLALAACCLLGAAAASAEPCPSASEIRERLDVAYADGVFVIGEGVPGGDVLMRLAAYAAAPKMIDQKPVNPHRPHAEVLALDLLPPQSAARAHYLVNGRFAGATDAERAAMRAAFLAACQATVDALAPRTPFRVAISDADMLGFYDERAGAFRLPEPPDPTRPFVLTDFLIPDRSLRYDPPELLWRMTPDAAEALLARLDAAAEVPSAARSVQAVTLVEVTRIDPETRAVELRVLDQGLYTRDFGERLHGYGGASAPPEAAPPPQAPAPDPAYASAEEAGAHALALCESSAATRTKLKCACVAAQVAERWARQPELHIYTHLNAVVEDSPVACANPEAVYAAELETCRAAWPSPFLSAEAAARLGMAGFCHCVADRAPSLARARAEMSCAEVVDYAVPEGSPLLE